MRILLASDFYPPFIGGAERQVQLLGRSLAVRGHAVSVATVWHRGMPEREPDRGVAVHRLKGLTTAVPWFSKDSRRRYHPPFPDPRIAWGVRRLVVCLQADLVHASGWIAYSCAAALLGTGVPLVASVRDYGYSCATRTLLHGGGICRGPAPRKCLGCAGRVYGRPKAVAAVVGVFGGRTLLRRTLVATHSVSRFVNRTVLRDLLTGEENGADRRHRVIPDLVDADVGSAEPGGRAVDDVLRCLPSQPFILFVGSLQAHKGLGTLLQAYRRLRSAPPLVLIGTRWPDSPRRFSPGVVVISDVPHAAVMAAWERCLFGVAPSIWPDPLPGVVREAMSRGKAVVGSAVGGVLDIIAAGETGLLVPPGDPEALAAAMQRLIDEPALREQLGRAAREQVGRFTPERVVGEYEALYRAALASGAPA